MPETVVRSIGPAPAAEVPSDPVAGSEDRIRAAVERQARAIVLRTLDRVPGYRMNSRILEGVLDECALTFPPPDLIALLEWLDREGLVTLRFVEGMVVATLRQKGADVARGRSLHEGVERPSPPT